MKSLADQVLEFMKWRAESSGAAYGPAELAKEVAAFQKGIEDRNKCKRQDIENLLRKDLRRPRYLPELAKAMGSTAEDLAAGRFSPGNRFTSMSQLSGMEGQLAWMYRNLSPSAQNELMSAAVALYAKEHPEPPFDSEAESEAPTSERTFRHAHGT